MPRLTPYTILYNEILKIELSLLPNEKKTNLTDEEVHLVLLEHLQLFLELGLYGVLTDAAKVGGCLADSSRHQASVLCCHLTSDITRRFVDLGSLLKHQRQ